MRFSKAAITKGNLDSIIKDDKSAVALARRRSDELAVTILDDGRTGLHLIVENKAAAMYLLAYKFDLLACTRDGYYLTALSACMIHQDARDYISNKHPEFTPLLRDQAIEAVRRRAYTLGDGCFELYRGSFQNSKQ